MANTEKGENKANAVSHTGHRQRMKERFLKNGLESMNGHEVLEMLLYYALPYKDTNGLGHQLEDAFGGLTNVLDANYADLVRIPGVTPHMATLITLCGQIAHRYEKERYAVGELLYTTEDYGNYLAPYFLGQKNESVVLLSLDNKQKVLNATRIFTGSVNSAQFNCRVAVQQALRDNATRVVLAHNHPNGFAFPSAADVNTTKHFASMMIQMEIRLMDHLVFAENDYISMADSRETANIFRFARVEAIPAKVAEKK